MNRAVTIDDVAAAAGVSTKTVSRVINGEPNVTDRTRERVERAIAELDYRPNVAARSLAAARTFLVGFITTYVEGSYFSKLHRSALRACRARGFHLVIEEVPLEGPVPIETLERNLRHMRYEGVLISPSVADDPRILEVLARLNIRYVRIAPTVDAGLSDAVFADESQGMTLLAGHLWRQGHRRIGLPTDAFDSVIKRRSERFAKAYLEFGGSDGDLHFATLDWHESIVNAGRRFAAELLSAPVRPTAIFTFSDDIAAAVVGYANEQGLRVPDDLSVTGFDDTYIAELIWPPLTTIHQPFDEMARSAVTLLLEPASDRKARWVQLGVDLVVRGSTAPVTVASG